MPERCEWHPPMTTTRVPAPDAVPLEALARGCKAACCLCACLLLACMAGRMLLPASSAACTQGKEELVSAR
jgi:hypothetical protein